MALPSLVHRNLLWYFGPASRAVRTCPVLCRNLDRRCGHSFHARLGGALRTHFCQNPLTHYFGSVIRSTTTVTPPPPDPLSERRSGAPPHSRHGEGARGAALEPQPLPQCGGVNTYSAFLDIEHTNSACSKRLSQVAFISGQLLKHPESAHKRRVKLSIAREIGDTVGDHGRCVRACECADLPRTNDGTVGLVQVFAERTHRDIRRITLAGQFVVAVASDHECCAANTGASERSTPDREFHEVPINRYPLRFGVGWDDAAISARSQLDTQRGVGRKIPYKREGWAVGLRVVQSGGGACHRVSSGRVKPDSINVEGHVFGARVQHGCAGERCEIVAGNRGGYLVGLDRCHLAIQRTERERIAADSAAEVGNSGQTRLREASGVQCSHRQPGCLFQPRCCEEHVSRELPELDCCLRPQFCLTEYGCDESGRMPCSPQVCDNLHDIVGLAPFGEVVEQSQTVSGEKLQQLGTFHLHTVAPCQHRSLSSPPRHVLPAHGSTATACRPRQPGCWC